MRSESVHGALVRAAMAFDAVAPFVDVTPADILEMRGLHLSGPSLVSITDGGEGRRGLVVARGVRALERLMALLAGAERERIVDDADLTALTFEPWSEAPGPARHLLRRAGYAGVRARGLVPVVLVSPPGAPARAPTGAEALGLEVILRALVEAWERGLLVPERLRRTAGLPTLRVEGDRAGLDVSIDGDAGAPSPGGDAAPPTLCVDVAALEQVALLDERWIVGCRPAPLTVEGEQGVARIFVVVEERRAQTLDGQVVVGPAWPLIAGERLFDVMLGGGLDHRLGRPRRLLFVDRALDGVAGPRLRALGVHTRLDPAVPAVLAGAFERLAEALARAAGDGGRAL